MNRIDIAYQVSLTLGDHYEDYNIDAIVDDLIAAHDGELASIDDFDSESYWAIVETHDTSSTRADEPTGFTAWLTTQASMTVNGERCEVNVAQDESTGDWEPMPTVQLPVPVADCNDESAQAAAEIELTKAGWKTVGEWGQYDHGYTVAVQRA